MISDINVVLLESEHPEHANDIAVRLNSAQVRSCVSIDHNSGIDYLNGLKPDLVILDPSLDADSSLKAIQKIKILNPVTPVLTSSEECLPAGECFAPFEGVHYLAPGAEQKVLENTVDEALVYSKEHAPRPIPPL
jgi:DNA-binding NarL/FixJ family response regulator